MRIREYTDCYQNRISIDLDRVAICQPTVFDTEPASLVTFEGVPKLVLLIKYEDFVRDWKNGSKPIPILSESSSIEELGLSTRTFHYLRKAGYRTIGDLTHTAAQQIRNIRNLGKKSYTELVCRLADNGFSLMWSSHQEDAERRVEEITKKPMDFGKEEKDDE